MRYYRVYKGREITVRHCSRNKVPPFCRRPPGLNFLRPNFRMIDRLVLLWPMCGWFALRLNGIRDCANLCTSGEVKIIIVPGGRREKGSGRNKTRRFSGGYEWGTANNNSSFLFYIPVTTSGVGRIRFHFGGKRGGNFSAHLQGVTTPRANNSDPSVNVFWGNIKTERYRHFLVPNVT